MAAPTAYAVSQSQFGLAVEATRGTYQAPAFWLPYTKPSYAAVITELEDPGLRGSAVKDYDVVQGQRHDELGWSGNLFLDSFPVLLRAILGSSDGVTAAPSSTTLSSAAAVGAASISTAASIASGSWITIGSGATLESHLTTGVTGAGPYTVALASTVIFPQGSGVTVSGMTGHKIGLLNNAGNGNQPPSLSLVDFDGDQWRAITAAQADSLSIKGNADGLLTYDTKFIGNPSVTPSTPSPSEPTADEPVPGWALAVSIGGTAVNYVLDYQVDLKRNTKAVPVASGSQAPGLYFADALVTKPMGKLTIVEQSGSPIVTDAINGSAVALDMTWFDRLSGYALNVHFSQARLITPKLDRSKPYVTASCDIFGKPNSTDAVAGGLSPVTATVANTQATSY